LLTGTGSGKLILYNLNTKANYSVIYNFNNPINGVLFVDNNNVVAFSSNGKIILYNLQNNNTDILNTNIVLKQMFKSDDIYYAVEKNGLLYRINSLQPLKYELYALKYSPDGKKGYLVKNDSSKIIINSAACSNDGKYIAIGDIIGNVLLFEKNNYKFLYRYRAHSARVNSIAFDKKSKYMATAGNDGKILIWTTLNFNIEPYKLVDNEAWVMLIKFNNENNLLSAYADGKIREWAVDYTEMAEEVKQKLKRNFTPEEWQQYVAKDINYQKTIPELP
jgi:WD40 repeat protein